MRISTLFVSFSVSCLLAVEAIHLREEEKEVVTEDNTEDKKTSEITIMQADPAPADQTPADDVEETALATSNISDSEEGDGTIKGSSSAFQYRKDEICRKSVVTLRVF